MTLAILFFFYQDAEVCEDRLQLLRKLNPDTPLFGLYGGSAGERAGMTARLAPRLDDLYVFDQDREPYWKWRNGDQLIAAWHRDRGHRLAWDTIVVVQWDMLVLEPIASLFGMVGEGQMLMSGLRPLAEVEDWWGWAKRKSKHRAELDQFMGYAADTFDYRGPALCALFIVVCLPRAFLDRYVAAGVTELGFLEYKIPTLAQAFGIPFCREHPFTPWWDTDPRTRNAEPRLRVLNALNEDIDPGVVRAELERPGGQRIFHPYRSLRPTWMG